MLSLARNMAEGEINLFPSAFGLVSHRGQTANFPSRPLRCPAQSVKADLTLPLNGLQGMIDRADATNVVFPAYSSTNQVGTAQALTAAGSTNMLIWNYEFVWYGGSWTASVLSAVQSMTTVSSFIGADLYMFRAPSIDTVMANVQAIKLSAAWTGAPGVFLIAGVSTIAAANWANNANFNSLAEVGKTPANYTGAWFSHVMTGINIKDMDALGYGRTVNFPVMVNFNPNFGGYSPAPSNFQAYSAAGNQSFGWFMFAPTIASFYVPSRLGGSISAFAMGYDFI